MKIRIGGGAIQDIRIEGPTSSQIHDVETSITRSIMGRIMSEAVVVSPKRMQRLATTVETAAVEEALKLFAVVNSVIGTAANQTGTPGIQGISLSTPYAREISGFVPWRPLSLSYLKWKRRRSLRRGPRRHNGMRPQERADRSLQASRSDSHFILSGQLKSYFHRNGRSIVLNRFGGIRTGLTFESRKQSERGIVAEDSHQPLGRIFVKIFPLVSASLMPMLASGRWTENPGRNYFEQATLPAGVATKLSGGSRGHYRPLVLPITQFFILHRIPGAITQELRRSTSKILR